MSRSGNPQEAAAYQLGLQEQVDHSVANSSDGLIFGKRRAKDGRFF
jgi:hypothetical protein